MRCGCGRIALGTRSHDMDDAGCGTELCSSNGEQACARTPLPLQGVCTRVLIVCAVLACQVDDEALEAATRSGLSNGSVP